LKKLKCLLFVMIFCLTIVGTAYAAPVNDLVSWDTAYCESSDTVGTLDYIDLGNPNDPVDVGSLTIDGVTNDRITCTIANGYPGYQASINTRIINVTDYPVRIVSLDIQDKPDCILLSLIDSEGNDLGDVNDPVDSDIVIEKNASLDVQLTTRVRQSANQVGSYHFSIELIAEQEEVTTRRKHNTGGGGGTPPVPNPIVIQNYEPIAVMPELPVAAPPELPNTGGDMQLLISSAAALGGLGVLLRRRK